MGTRKIVLGAVMSLAFLAAGCGGGGGGGVVLTVTAIQVMLISMFFQKNLILKWPKSEEFRVSEVFFSVRHFNFLWKSVLVRPQHEHPIFSNFWGVKIRSGLIAWPGGQTA